MFGKHWITFNNMFMHLLFDLFQIMNHINCCWKKELFGFAKLKKIKQYMLQCCAIYKKV